MIVTEEIFNQGMSSKNGHSDEQIRCFGVERKNNQGWKDEIIGKDFPPETIDLFISLKDKHLKTIQLKDDEIDRNYQQICKLIMANWFRVLGRALVKFFR